MLAAARLDFDSGWRVKRVAPPQKLSTSLLLSASLADLAAT
jgi:hypothetical protein